MTVAILLAQHVCHGEKTRGRQRHITVRALVKQRVVGACERSCDAPLADFPILTTALVDLC